MLLRATLLTFCLATPALADFEQTSPITFCPATRPATSTRVLADAAAKADVRWMA